jgi:hypothetical protein
MRRRVALLIVLTVSGCSRNHDQHHDAERDRDSPAFKAGQAAHVIASHAEKTAAEAARELQETARKAKEGWKQKEREDREKAGQGR